MHAKARCSPGNALDQCGRRQPPQVRQLQMLSSIGNLHHQAEDGKETGSDDWKAVCVSELKSARTVGWWSRLSWSSIILLSTSSSWLITLAKTLVRSWLWTLLLLPLIGIRASSSLRGAGGGSGGGNVDASWVGSSAWVILTTAGLAEVIAWVAAADAVLLPVLTDVVWDGDGVLGHVWRVAVAAFALPDQSLLKWLLALLLFLVPRCRFGKTYWFTRVGVGSHGSLLLSAKLWAGGSLIRAPGGCYDMLVAIRNSLIDLSVRHTLRLDINSLWVNPVLLLSLSRRDDDGNEAGDLERQHVADNEADAEQVESLNTMKVNSCQSCLARVMWVARQPIFGLECGIMLP